MQPISMCWLAVQQQTSTFKRQKFGLFYLKLSAEFNGLFFILKATGSDQKIAKTELVQKKTPISVIRRLRVKRQVKTLGGVP